jgi:predicted RNase H-like HicB family nuclease
MTADFGVFTKVHKVLQCATNGHMKFPTVIYQDEDEAWIVECPAIPGCVSQGRTREEAMENIKDAITACLEVRVGRDRS